MPDTVRFNGCLTQDRIDQLARVLYRAEQAADVQDPGGIAALEAARMLTEIRVEFCQHGGASDPYPAAALFPHFDDTRILPGPQSLWADAESTPIQLQDTQSRQAA